MMLPKVVRALTRNVNINIAAPAMHWKTAYPLGTEDKKALIMLNQSCGSLNASLTCGQDHLTPVTSRPALFLRIRAALYTDPPVLAAFAGLEWMLTALTPCAFPPYSST